MIVTFYKNDKPVKQVHNITRRLVEAEIAEFYTLVKAFISEEEYYDDVNVYLSGAMKDFIESAGLAYTDPRFKRGSDYYIEILSQGIEFDGETYARNLAIKKAYSKAKRTTKAKIIIK